MEDAQRVLALSPTNQTALSIFNDAKAQMAGLAQSAKAASAAKNLAGAMATAGEVPGGGDHAGGAGRAGAQAADPRIMQAKPLIDQAGNLLKLKDYQGALEAARRATAADPGNGDAYMHQAMALAALTQLGEALKVLDKAIEALAQRGQRESLPAAYGLRGSYKYRNKDYAGAVDDAGKAIELDPKSADAYYLRSQSEKALGRGDAALADLKTAAQYQPGRYQDAYLAAARAAAGGENAAAPAPGRGDLLRALRGMDGSLLLAIAGAGMIGSALIFLWIFRRRSPVGYRELQSSAAVSERIGKTIGRGQYKIVRQIGEGGMGTVYEAQDARLGRLVAVKCLRPELESRPAECARFVKEARIVAGLQHPHVVQIHTIIHEDSSTYVVYEHLGERTLQDELSRQPKRRLEPRRALGILQQISLAVDYAHGRNIIHRDLKPSNVMLTSAGAGEDWAKVMDFGIARQVHDILNGAATKTIVGTPPYMAPEQALGVVTKASDVFALGVMFYEMLTGDLPFKGDEVLLKAETRAGRFAAPSLLVPGLPRGVDAAVDKALLADPAKRHRTCLDFCKAVASALPQAASA